MKADGKAAARQPVSPTRFAVVTGIVLLALVILGALGTWQVNRLQWKEALIARIDARMRAAPVSIGDAEKTFAETADVDYMPVTLSGSFEHGGEQHFFATHQGASGFYLYTPFRLADGRAVFVNRGFAPYDRKDAATRPEGQVTGVVTITGMARNPLPGKPSSVYENDPARNIYYWKDRDEMAKAAGLDPALLLPFFVDAGEAPNPGGWPVGGVTLVSLPNNHLQYAVTWYGLALALIGVWGVWAWQTRQQR